MRRHSTAKTIWLNILGYFFLFLAVLGALFPVLQGWLFLLIALAILSETNPWAKRLLQKFRERFPKVAKKSDEMLVKWKLKRPVSEHNRE